MSEDNNTNNRKEPFHDGIGMTIADYDEKIDYLTQENSKLKKKVNDLTILIYQVLDQDESDFFDDNVRTIERQNIRRLLKAKFPLTAEQVDIVNKNKEQLQQNSTNS